jgi:hypothetical protein
MARQQMLTKENRQQLPPLYAQDGKGMDAIAYVKFFNPCGSGTWYITEFDPETNMAFGLACLQERELGYIDLNELMAVKLRFGLYIERDIHFKPTKLSECQ